MPKTIEIPYAPRPLQRTIAERMRGGVRFGVLVCHRRFGKTVLGVNLLQQSALMLKRLRPHTAYLGPTYRQSKAVAWDYLKYYSRPITGVTANETELRVDYPQQSQVRLYGADDPDKLRGIYLDGVVLDEYGHHPAKTFTEVIGPALVDRGGWALFLGTPNGKNQFYEIAQTARARQADGDKDWAFWEYKASDTGLLDADYLRQARSVMTEDEYQQEFECSFEAAVRGAIYGKEMSEAEADGRITAVPYDPALPVDTDWDLGMDDHTAIWFSQSTRGGEVRLIDYFEDSGEGLPYYANVLRDKRYTYGQHWAPHDIKVRELASGRSRLEAARALGIGFRVAPKLKVEEGIHAARILLPRCWFDRVKTEPGREALKHYRRDYNARLNELKSTPVHDFASHGSDAFRTLAVRHRNPGGIIAPVQEYKPTTVWG